MPVLNFSKNGHPRSKIGKWVGESLARGSATRMTYNAARNECTSVCTQIWIRVEYQNDWKRRFASVSQVWVRESQSMDTNCIYEYIISKLYIYNIQKAFFFCVSLLVCMLCQSKFLIIPNSQGPEALNWLVSLTSRTLDVNNRLFSQVLTQTQSLVAHIHFTISILYPFFFFHLCSPSLSIQLFTNTCVPTKINTHVYNTTGLLCVCIEPE